MDHDHRSRRVIKLCLDSIRNITFYKSGFKDGRILYNDQFWITANGNFLDIAVLEWCKMFGDWNSKHHWRLVINSDDSFLMGLLAELDLTEAEYNTQKARVRHYRDKFIAHLDDENTMHIPDVSMMEKSVYYLFDCLRTQEVHNPLLVDCSPDPSLFRDGYMKDMTKYLQLD